MSAEAGACLRLVSETREAARTPLKLESSSLQSAEVLRFLSLIDFRFPATYAKPSAEVLRFLSLIDFQESNASATDRHRDS